MIFWILLKSLTVCRESFIILKIKLSKNVAGKKVMPLDIPYKIDNKVQIVINEIINTIRSIINVKKIILFGSYAYGVPTKGSDIDLCIITDDNRRKIDIITDIQSSIYKNLQYPVDILVYKPEDFENRADSISTIEKTISKKGLVIYG